MDENGRDRLLAFVSAFRDVEEDLVEIIMEMKAGKAFNEFSSVEATYVGFSLGIMKALGQSIESTSLPEGFEGTQKDQPERKEALEIVKDLKEKTKWQLEAIEQGKFFNQVPSFKAFNLAFFQGACAASVRVIRAEVERDS